MSNQATYEDVNLVLKLYEMRREEKMRSARSWFAGNFLPANMEEFMKVAPPGSEQNAYFRQVASYWEMVAGFITLLILSKSGFFSRALYQLHLINQLESFPGMVNDPFGLGIIITHSLMAIPFLLIYFSSLYDSENICELEMLATNLGSGTWQTTRFIILPMLLRKGFPTLLLYFIFVLGSYEVPLLLGVQSPQMISLLILRKLQRFNLLDIPQGYCIALLYTFLLTVLLLLFFKSKKTTQS